MKLERRERQYWNPELENAPSGAVSVKAELIADEWVDFETVDEKQVILVAGPDVDTDTYPHPAETVVLPLGIRRPKVLLVGPGSKEILIRDAGSIDVS